MITDYMYHSLSSCLWHHWKYLKKMVLKLLEKIQGVLFCDDLFATLASIPSGNLWSLQGKHGKQPYQIRLPYVNQRWPFVTYRHFFRGFSHEFSGGFSTFDFSGSLRSEEPLRRGWWACNGAWTRSKSASLCESRGWGTPRFFLRLKDLKVETTRPGLVNIQKAIEHGPFHSYVLVYQRVHTIWFPEIASSIGKWWTEPVDLGKSLVLQPSWLVMKTRKTGICPLYNCDFSHLLYPSGVNLHFKRGNQL